MLPDEIGSAENIKSQLLSAGKYLPGIYAHGLGLGVLQACIQ